MNMERVILILSNQCIFEADVADEELKVKKFSPLVLKRGDMLITFQPDELVSQLGLDGIQKVDILDFECIDKQIRQSIGLQSAKDGWSVVNMIATYLRKEERKWQEEEYEDLLKELTLCYREMKEKGKDEWIRITTIEIPINRILYEIQAKGIYFNNDLVETKCRELHKKLYGYKNIIQLDLEYAGSDLISYLDFHHIPHRLHINSSDTEYKDICKKLFPKLEPFWKIKVAERNLKCLLFLSACRHDSNVCKPIFKGFASSTGRIYLRDPALQNLSKTFRTILKSNLDSDWRYEYIDFGQFEAGILAGLTNNDKLQNLYEKDQIYNCLADMTNSDRETAKIYFYRFVYGGVVTKGTENFFSTFHLKDTVDKVVKTSLKNGYVTTALGNKRMIVNEDDQSWILNHYIQGTSSLIFKQALINVQSNLLEKVELVLPVHDAALFKVHKDIQTESLIAQFEKAFNFWIPNSKPLIKVKNFFEE